MAIGSPKYYSSTSNYPRALSSIITSVGLLAVFITLTSWILSSYPIGTVVRSYFYGVDQTSDLELPMSWEVANKSRVHGEGKSEGTIEVSQDQNLDDVQQKDVSLSSKNGTLSREEVIEKPIPIEDNDSLRNDDVGLPKSEGTSKLGQNQHKEDVQQKGISFDNNTMSGEQVIENPIQAKDKDSMKKDDANLPKFEGTSEDSRNQNVEDSTVPREHATDNPKPTEDSDPGKTELNNATSAGLPISETKIDKIDSKESVASECDLYHGEWFYDSAGPLYTSSSCPIITQMQKCQENGRPDKEYENWRWRPTQCELPRFNATKFLELMRGKTLAFVGDSVARNQMESLTCLLWQAEVPKNRGNRHMQRWNFRSYDVMIVRVWSSWLVNVTSEALGGIPEGVPKLHLDVPDETFMRHIPKFDVVVLSSGHWFAKQSIYVLNNEIVGTQLWPPPANLPMKINNVEAFAISVDTSLTAMVTHPNFTGLTILRAYSPDHYEGGAWNTGGSCTGKVGPTSPGQLVENKFTNSMHEKQVSGFNKAIKKQTNRSKLKLMDITEPFSYRPDGHPGPYRSPDPNKITQRGPDGKPPPQDCLHWCMPGPIDTWNEFLLEVIRQNLS
ncbi:unnamed protein product [Amaranthus hypochondriacus]